MCTHTDLPLIAHVLRLRRYRPRFLPHQSAPWCRPRNLQHRNLHRGPLTEKPQREPHKPTQLPQSRLRASQKPMTEAKLR